MGQFHQCSTSSFHVIKLRLQLFCAYVLGLFFTGARLLAQKLRAECWWNWPLVSLAIRDDYVSVKSLTVNTKTYILRLQKNKEELFSLVNRCF
jgi:hypothetical protein